MLQWMGGARRKVASTRKSTQNRQKQYFEQRRLQQQAANAGKVSEGRNTYSENSRSLDVLSLLNLSNVTQEPKTTCNLASNVPENKAPNYRTVQPLQTFGRFHVNEAKSPLASTTKDTCSSSSRQPEIANTKTTSARTAVNPVRVSNSDNEKNQFKLGPESRELHMIDILGDEDPNTSLHKSLEREAHAAFSIEGLGEVEMETPVHTPVQSPVHSPQGHISDCRTFLHGCSSPSKDMKPTFSFNLDSKLDNLEFELEVDVPSCRSSTVDSLGSKDMLGSFCKPKKGLFGTKDFSLFNGSCNDCNELLGDDELFFHSRKGERHTWDEKSSSLPRNIFNENAFDLSHDDWASQMDASIDYASSMNHKKKEFTFQDSHRLSRTMNRSAKLEAAGAFPANFYPHHDSPAPYLSYQKPETSLNYRMADSPRYSPVRRNYDAGDFLHQPTQPYYRYEDTRDNMSLLSEESCSSTAVKGASRKGTFSSKEKQSLGMVEVSFSDSFCSEDDVPGWEENCEKWKISHEGQETWTGNHRTSNPLRLRPAQTSYTTSEKRLKSDNSRLFKTEIGRGTASSGHDYFNESEEKQTSPWNSKHWIEDFFDTSEYVGSYSTGSDFDKSCKLSAGCSPCCKFKSEKRDLHPPNLDNSILISSMLKLSEDCNLECGHLKSVHEQSCIDSEQQSTTRVLDEDSDVHTTEHEKYEPERKASSCRESLSSKNGNSRDAADIEDECSDCDECKDGPAEDDGLQEMNCDENAAETPTAIDIPGIADGNECNVGEINKTAAPTSLSCQTVAKAKFQAEGFHSKQYNINGEENCGVDSRSQVMMPNSYILQFLCIQVLRNASAKVTHKQH